jgi:hypothetical protein
MKPAISPWLCRAKAKMQAQALLICFGYLDAYCEVGIFSDCSQSFYHLPSGNLTLLNMAHLYIIDLPIKDI